MKDLLLNVSLRTRMLLSNIVVALIPFLMFSIVSGSIFLDHAQKTAEEHSVQLIHQVSNSMDVYVETIEKMVNYIQLELQDTPFFTMETEDAPGWESETDYIRSVLENVANSHREVAGIFIATKEDLYVSTGMSRISRDPFQNERWYREASENPEEIQLISVVTGRNIVTNRSYSIDDVFSLAKAVQDPETGEVLGVILLDIRHDIIQSSINGVTIGEKGFVFVMDQEDNIVYTPVNGIVYRVNPKWVKAMEPMSVQIQGGSYQIRSELSPYTGWRTVGVFSMDEVMSSVNTIVYILFTCVIISLVLVVIVSFKFSRTLTNPIFKLKRLMKQAESGDLTVRFNFQHNDEIGELGQSFNHMIARIDQLIQMVYVEQENKRTAEMKSLQEQIKPHFLYNTLDTMSGIANAQNCPMVSGMCHSLSAIFRYSLNMTDELSTVQNEMAHVRNYLYVMDMRNGSTIAYDYQIDSDTLADQMPRICIQPVVENALTHGLRNVRRKDKKLLIRSEHVNENLVITVQDNGAGMDAESMNRLLDQNDMKRVESGISIGILNVNARLKRLFGEKYGLHIESTAGEGTTVTITVPAVSTENSGDMENV